MDDTIPLLDSLPLDSCNGSTAINAHSMNARCAKQYKKCATVRRIKKNSPPNPLSLKIEGEQFSDKLT